MKNSRLISGLSLMLALLMFNCNTPSNLLQEGDYDEAVYQAVKNLRKKKKKREKDILVVEEAFRKITQRDMNQIAALKAEGQAVNWVKINELHNNIKYRQDLISPYLPLIATKTRYKADFRFVKIIPLELDSRRKAAEYYYNGGKREMEDAVKGDKAAARSAHRKFTKVQNYFEDYKDNVRLMDSAYEIGLDKVLLEMRNSSYAIIPMGFEDELLAFNERNLDQIWKNYYKAHYAPSDIDYKVIIDINEINVSPESVRENSYEVSKVLSKKEKVKVNKTFTADRLNSKGDSVRVTRPVMEEVEVPFTVVALITDIRQQKSAFVNARVSFYDANSKTLIDTDRINATIDFNHVASTFRGDRRAIPANVRSRIGGTPVCFPSDSHMVLDAAGQLKGKITNCIRRTDTYVMR